MRKEYLLEKMLGLLTTQPRAAAIVGDLLEELPRRGRLWFWGSFAGAFLSFTWRWLAACVVAFYVELICLGALQMPAGVGEHHQVFGVPAAPPAFIILASSSLVMMTAYLAIRFGVKERFTQLAGAYAGLAVFLDVFWWMSSIRIALAVVLVAGGLAAMLASAWRRALLGVVAGLCSSVVCALSAMAVEALHEHYTHASGVNAESHLPGILMIGWILCATTALTRIRALATKTA